MKNSTLLSALVPFVSLITRSVSADDGTSKIVGGEQANPGDYPYYVDMNGCGGALVAPDIVLTAAHCGDRTGDEVIVGAYKRGSTEAGGEKRICEKYIEDPKYNDYTLNNDFGVCKLDSPVFIDEGIVKLELNEDASIPSDGEDLHVMGLGTLHWGGTSPKYLHHVQVPYVDNTECNELYGGDIENAMLCAGVLSFGGKDSCQGDSGGPIVQRITKDDGSYVDTHVGVVSWGIGCAFPDYPGVYARTSMRSEWIKTTMCDELESIDSACGNETNQEEGCVDDESFRYKNRPKQTCKKYLKSKNTDKVKRRCKKMWRGKKVHKWCPKTCGEKGGIGACAVGEPPVPQPVQPPQGVFIPPTGQPVEPPTAQPPQGVVIPPTGQPVEPPTAQPPQGVDIPPTAQPPVQPPQGVVIPPTGQPVEPTVG